MNQNRDWENKEKERKIIHVYFSIHSCLFIFYLLFYLLFRSFMFVFNTYFNCSHSCLFVFLHLDFKFSVAVCDLNWFEGTEPRNLCFISVLSQDCISKGFCASFVYFIYVCLLFIFMFVWLFMFVCLFVLLFMLVFKSFVSFILLSFINYSCLFVFTFQNNGFLCCFNTKTIIKFCVRIFF